VAQQPPSTAGSTAHDQEGLPSAPEPQNNAPAPTPPPPQVSQPQHPVPPQQPESQPKQGITGTTSRDEVYTLIKTVNFVVVPVTVKDDSGRLVDGLVKKDFSVYENGLEQSITVFSSEPFPLSAAVVLDVNLPQMVVRQVNDSMSALVGAFSQFDEVAFYTYGDTVTRRLNFSAVNDELATTMKRIKPRGTPGGVPVVGGPFGAGPTVNNEPVIAGQPHIPTPPKESHVLNDAILAAALDLSHREKARRKIIFVISNGRENGSRASYAEVLKVLLSDNIMLYAVAVSESAMPGIKDIGTVHVPGLGYSNILPKYAAATGGEVFPEMSSQAIESAYSRLAADARNQYTLGYVAKATKSNEYRSIEVRVHLPNLLVHAKDGYYPLPISSVPY
jgi:VWFA-related protein